VTENLRSIPYDALPLMQRAIPFRGVRARRTPLKGARHPLWGREEQHQECATFRNGFKEEKENK